MVTIRELLTEPAARAACRRIMASIKCKEIDASDIEKIAGLTRLATTRKAVFNDDDDKRTLVVVTVSAYTYEEIVK